jgi:hypothetical protein
LVEPFEGAGTAFAADEDVNVESLGIHRIRIALRATNEEKRTEKRSTQSSLSGRRIQRDSITQEHNQEWLCHSGILAIRKNSVTGVDDG